MTARVSGTPRIAAIIVNYGTAELVMENLPSLTRALEAFPGSAIYLVDNASPNGDAERLSAFLARHQSGDGSIQLIASPENGGFAKGNNIAFAAIRNLKRQPDYVFLLNPDAKVLSGAIPALVDFLETNESAAVAGARLENPDGSPRAAAFHFPTLAREIANTSGLDVLVKRWPLAWPCDDAPQRVDWVSGAAMMFRARLLDDIGDMDGGYFLYYEETDYMREIARRGGEVWHVPAARVLHIAGSATGMAGGAPRAGRMPAYWFQSWLRYYAKNYGTAYARLAGVSKLTAMLVYICHRRLRGRSVDLAEGFIADFARSCVFGRPPADLSGTSRQ